MRKYKKMIISLLFVVIIISLNNFMSFMLVSPGLTRVILHELDENHDFKYVFLGTSHGSYAIDANIVSEQAEVKSMNLCIGGEYLQDSYYLLKQVYQTNSPEQIILDMDFQYLVNVPKNSVAANFIYHAYPNSLNKIPYFYDKIYKMEYRAALFPWMDYRNNYGSVISIMKTKLGTDYRNYSAKSVTMESPDHYLGRGFIFRDRTNPAKIDTMGQLTWDSSMVDEDSLGYLDKIIALCREHNTKLTMMSSPIPVETIQNSLDGYNNGYTYLAELAKKKDIKYYNFNLIKETVYPRNLDDYYDYDGHMYGDTAQRYSEFLGLFLKDVINENFDSSKLFYNSVYEIK